jgi:hypothetical protein
MGKMFLSLGFWMTILLFIALGYTFEYAWGAERSDAMNPAYTRATFASSDFSDRNLHFENDLGASDVARRSRCASAASPRTDYPDFQQMANLQAGDAPVYAPGLSFSITHRPPEVALCPGPVEIPRH